MKIRVGFVSNSSTSSFCIYGVKINSDEIKDIIKGFDCVKDIDLNLDKWERKVDWEEIKIQVIKILGKEFSFFFSIDTQCFFYIGRELLSLKGNETGYQFKDSVEKIREKFSLKNDCQIINEILES